MILTVYFKVSRDESLVLQVGYNLLLNGTVVVAMVLVGTSYTSQDSLQET